MRTMRIKNCLMAKGSHTQRLPLRAPSTNDGMLSAHILIVQVQLILAQS